MYMYYTDNVTTKNARLESSDTQDSTMTVIGV